MFRGGLKVYISIVLISLISTAAAMWSDSLKISTTIKTGDPDVDFDGIGTDDPPGSKDPGYDKDVASCTAEENEVENEEEEFQGSTGNKDLDVVINISNGYPSYTFTAYTVIVNTGTVPLSLIQWFILPVQPSGGVNQTSALPLDIGLEGIWVGCFWSVVKLIL